MSTDYQQARAALGVRLRELRLACPDGRLTGTQLAELLGWPRTKVSKLENGRQAATPEDLRAWAGATGQPELEGELQARLKGFESHIRSFRRQLTAGYRPVQETWNSEIAKSRAVQAWEGTVVAGMLQTADYARHVLIRYADLHQNPHRDIDDAVRARIQRQQWLYQPGKAFHIILWEAALHALVCPPSVLAAQLDRLAGAIGLDTLTLGIIPFGASLKISCADGFLILDDRVAITEDWHAELWLDDADTVATYRRVWDMLGESAVYGADAHNVINNARRSLAAG
ncbi:helix-turn-helix transcriptional regulator [Streptomyces sp. NPDC052496]|uniref:helix-turn-helix domain-containing protein n=1 Tax=Streptomyces sp. NPDC052496 TaxID=3154951 RepID=UPI00344A09BD